MKHAQKYLVYCYLQCNCNTFTFAALVIFLITLLACCGIYFLSTTSVIKDVDLEVNLQPGEGDSNKQQLESQLRRIHCRQDEARVQKVLDGPPNPITMKHYYQVIMNPLQEACNSMRKIGLGSWVVSGYDGHKFVCMDDLTGVDANNCVVLSFGIAHETSFEREMNALGCVIHGYDHSISKKARESQENRKNGFFIYGKGIDTKASKKMTTLEAELDKLGLRDKNITYLKMDIEGAEKPVLLNWIDSGLLKNVQQLGVEFHNVKSDNVQVFWDIVEGLYRQGFRLMTFAPNYALRSESAGENWEKAFIHPLHEVTFRKVNTAC